MLPSPIFLFVEFCLLTQQLNLVSVWQSRIHKACKSSHGHCFLAIAGGLL